MATVGDGGICQPFRILHIVLCNNSSFGNQLPQKWFPEESTDKARLSIGFTEMKENTPLNLVVFQKDEEKKRAFIEFYSQVLEPGLVRWRNGWN